MNNSTCLINIKRFVILENGLLHLHSSRLWKKNEKSMKSCIILCRYKKVNCNANAIEQVVQPAPFLDDVKP